MVKFVIHPMLLDQEELEFQKQFKQYVLNLDDEVLTSIKKGKNAEEWRIDICKMSGLKLPKRMQEEIKQHDAKIESCKHFLRSQDLLLENNRLYRYYLSSCTSKHKVSREQFGELVMDVSIECLEMDY